MVRRKRLRRGPPVVKNSIFAVHEWETTTGLHSVHVWDSKGRIRTKEFKDWEDAELYAQKKAVKMKLKKYQVDTPSRPHVFVGVPKHIRHLRK